MISFAYFISFFCRSTSIPYIGSLVLSISVMFIVELVMDTEFSKSEKKNMDSNNINMFKYNLSLFLSCFPCTHVFKILMRLLKAELKWSVVDLTYQDFYPEFIQLFLIGTVMSIIVIFKIFIFDKLNLSKYDKYFSKFTKFEYKKVKIDDLDVLEEIEFTKQKASNSNSILRIESFDKLYISLIRRIFKYACKDVSFSLRNNEVTLY